MKNENSFRIRFINLLRIRFGSIWNVFFLEWEFQNSIQLDWISTNSELKWQSNGMDHFEWFWNEKYIFEKYPRNYQFFYQLFCIKWGQYVTVAMHHAQSVFKLENRTFACIWVHCFIWIFEFIHLFRIEFINFQIRCKNIFNWIPIKMDSYWIALFLEISLNLYSQLNWVLFSVLFIFFYHFFHFFIFYFQFTSLLVDCIFLFSFNSVFVVNFSWFELFLLILRFKIPIVN